MAFFSRTTWVSRHQNGEPFWILMKQEMVGGSGMSWTICKSYAPHSRQITMPVNVFMMPLSSLRDSFKSVLFVQRWRVKVMRTVLCCVVYYSCVRWYAHTHEQFVRLRFSLMYRSMSLLTFNILCIFLVSLEFLFLYCLILVLSFQYQSKRLAGNNISDMQWRRYARSWQVLCPASEKIGPGAGTCMW